MSVPYNTKFERLPTSTVHPLVIKTPPTPCTVPRACVLDLWEAFNDVAEGFGLTIIEFREMLQCSLKEYLGFTEKRLVEVADAVFRVFDDDKVWCTLNITRAKRGGVENVD